MRRRLMLLAVLMVTTSAIADTYTWTDDKGAVVFTDNPGSIPKKRTVKVRRKPDIPYETETPKAAVPQPVQKAEPGIPGAADVEGDAVYGGKPLKSWKAEFDGMRADMKRLTADMDTSRQLIGAVPALNRAEYIAVQKKLRGLESEALKLQDRIVALKKQAATAGVPLQIRGE